MRTPALALAAGALVIATVASAASAQVDSVRRTSTSRIPISKGEPPRVDTLMVFRTDTVTREITKRIHDTVRVRRVDTVRVATVPLRPREIGGFYIGLSTGPAIPTGDNFTTFQHTGWHLEVPVGYDPLFIPIGGRVNFGYSQFGRRGPFEQAFTTPEIFHIDGNLKLRYPVASPWMRRFQVYATGGVSYNWHRSLALVDERNGLIIIGDSVGVAPDINGGFPSVVDNSWHENWGWNAGGGVQMGWKHTQVFLESRVVHFSHEDIGLSQVPILLGVSWIGTDWW
jgi:hypothetical protein